MSQQVITAHDVCSGYGDAEVLRGVSVRLDQGEIVGLIGPNGVGKTTLLKCMAGLMPIGSGKLRVFERDVTASSTLELRLAGLGYVPQERNVFPNLSVRENLETAYRVAGKGAAAIDIYERMVALGMGLMLKPQALLLDEPTTGLAPIVVYELMRAIRKLRESEGISILIVEQNIASMLKVVDRLYIMKENVCREFDGEPADLGRQNIWEYL